MTSTIRVSEIKNRKGSVYKNTDGKPREGTDLRVAYDSLRKGEIVSFPRQRSYRQQLTDFYGMDIVKVQTGQYRLVGEWDGPYYIPVERIVLSLMEPA